MYFDDEVIEVVDRSTLKVVAHGYQEGGLYCLKYFTSSLQSNNSHLHQLFSPSKALLTDEVSHLWHHRLLGHTPVATLQHLVSHNMVEGLPKLCKTHHVCPSCAKIKLSRSSFPEEASHRASRILELIHDDLAGPLEVESLVGGFKVLSFTCG